MNFLKRIAKKVNRRICQTALLVGDSESVRFDRTERHTVFQVFDQLVILPRSEERKEAAAYLSEG